MTGVLIKKGNSDTDTYTGKTPCKDEGRDQGNSAEARKCHRLRANHQKLGGRHGADFALTAH